MRVIDYGIMAVVAVVLLVVGIMLLPSGPTQASLDDSYKLACGQLLEQNCEQASINSITGLESDKTTYTLGTLCAQKGYTDTASCAKSCGCVNTETASTDLVDMPLTAYSDNPVTQGALIDEGDLFEY